MIPWWGLAVLVLGANFALWGSIGVCRLSGMLVEKVHARRAARAGLHSAAALPDTASSRRKAAKMPGWDRRRRAGPLTVRDVAVLIPAHNESVVIEDTLRAITALVPRGHVHVVSDASTDDTVEIARRAGAKVIETTSNVGKAGALREAIERFGLIRRFQVVMLLDADTRVEPNYFVAGLPMFDSPDVVAVAGCVRTAGGRHLSTIGRILVSHRQRIYAIGQRVLKFGQTWLRTNATHIVPGFASMYRTDVLPYIDMNPPGLVIEDFNMTFEIYQKRLGKVGFTLSAVAVTQDPDNFHDYVRQTRRWAVGMWQTVRRHPPRANLFTAMLTLLLMELIISSLLYLLLPLLLIVLVLPDMAHGIAHWAPFAEVHLAVASHMKLDGMLFGVLVPDFALTVAVTLLDRRPWLLLIAPFFPLLRLVDSAIGLTAIPFGWFSASTGRWKSPARRALPDAAQPAPAIAAAAGQPSAVKPVAALAASPVQPVPPPAAAPPVQAAQDPAEPGTPAPSRPHRSNQAGSPA
ncbi:MAG TPA: glycosyltransferase family 2 protein [Streptosporangiaceae bacterium]|nr:glycosyltransferase family 2 protein [Streptosporangiaceae bacterium]